MGSAVWEFLWCLDRMTRIDPKGFGWILGGAPIKLRNIAESLGRTDVSISRNLSKLSSEGYIALTHAPYGIVIKVPKAKKRFNRNVNPQNAHRFNNRDKATFNNVAKPHCESAKPLYDFVKPNKTVSVDNTEDRELIARNARIQTMKNEITKLFTSFR